MIACVGISFCQWKNCDCCDNYCVIRQQDYDSKMEEILTSDYHISLNKIPQYYIPLLIFQRKVHNSFVKQAYLHLIPYKVRIRLTPHHLKVPHMYGLPNVHKERVPLRHIVSSRFGPVYKLSKYMLLSLVPTMRVVDTRIRALKIS